MADVLSPEELQQALSMLDVDCALHVRWRHRRGHTPQLWRGTVMRLGDSEVEVHWFEGPKNRRDAAGAFPRDDIQYLKVGVRYPTENTLTVFTPGAEPRIQHPNDHAQSDAGSAAAADDEGEEEEEEEEVIPDDVEPVPDQATLDVQVAALEAEHIASHKETQKLEARIRTLEASVANIERLLTELRDNLPTAVAAPQPVQTPRLVQNRNARDAAIDAARARLRDGRIGNGAAVASPLRSRPHQDQLSALQPSTWPIIWGPESRFIFDELRDTFVTNQPSDLRPRAAKALAHLRSLVDDRAKCASSAKGRGFDAVADFWLAKIEAALFQLRVETQGRQAGADVEWLLRQYAAAGDLDDPFAALLAQAPAAPKDKPKPQPKKSKKKDEKKTDGKSAAAFPNGDE